MGTEKEEDMKELFTMLLIALQRSDGEGNQNEDIILKDALCVLIESLAKQPNQDVAKQIWCNLQQPEESESLPDKSKKEITPRIYISYNWDDEAYCRTFVKALHENTTVPIWVDYEKTDELEDSWEYAAPAIESATVIIVLASSAYVCSNYSYQELLYATLKSSSSSEKKKFIVVNIESDLYLKQTWMSSLLEEKIEIEHNHDTEELARKVADQDPLSNKKKHVLVSCSSGFATQSSVCILM
ncbi:unnamed protein product [Adineta steineri]|nr:unnamed protein product [Adineta steineri]CAF1528380.1 unnamed protein product [Adineta steineri]CAF3734072.1 unnamed protein product [Adineta steineri]